MAVNIIRKFLMKKLMKPDASGIMKIPEKGKLDFSEHFLRERLFTNGVDHKLINNERQLENILQSINEAEARKLKQESARLGLTDPKKSGEVVEVDFDKGRWNKASGGRTGLSYLLAEDTNERVPYAEGNGVYDEDVAKKKFGERVRRLMDEGYDFAEAVKEAMKEEGFAEGGRVPYFEGAIVDPEGYNITRREMGILANANPSMREMIREFLTSRRKHKFVYPDRILEMKAGRRTGEASGGRAGLLGERPGYQLGGVLNIGYHGTSPANLRSIATSGFTGGTVPTWAGTGKTFTTPNINVASTYGPRQIPIVQSAQHFKLPGGGIPGQTLTEAFKNIGKTKFGFETALKPDQATKGMTAFERMKVKYPHSQTLKRLLETGTTAVTKPTNWLKLAGIPLSALTGILSSTPVGSAEMPAYGSEEYKALMAKEALFKKKQEQANIFKKIKEKRLAEEAAAAASKAKWQKDYSNWRSPSGRDHESTAGIGSKESKKGPAGGSIGASRFRANGGLMMADGGIAGMLGERTGYQNGLLANIPPEYRLYAGTMLPGNQTGTIDESYFNQDFKDQVKDQVLSKMDRGMEFEGYKHPKAFPSGTVRKGQIFPRDYVTEKNPFGYTSPQYGIGRTNPTGYSSVFNTLGTYDYKYNMPNAPDFSNASIDITDKYDWNPNYGTVGDFTGYIGQGYGREDDEDYVKGTDVDAKMLKEYVFNQIKNRKLNVGAGLELLGNYFGPRASEGKGKDIEINIPVKKKKKYVSPASPHGNGGGGGRRPDNPGGFTNPGKGSYGPHMALGGRAGFAEGKGPKMSRRNFLKIMGGLAALPVVGKFFKWAKPLAKTAKVADLTSVPIKNIEGMPSWFKPLVNRVIKEGKEAKVTEYDRLITHTAKLPESKTPISVSQDLNTGDVWVDIGEQTKHGWADGHYGQPVRLEYKAAEDIISGPSDEPFKVGVRDPLLREKVSIHKDLVKDIKPGKEGLRLKPGKTKEEFWIEEAEFTGGHPENVKFEESTFEKFGDHGSNFDEVEKFATGKVKKSKPTKKRSQTEWEQEKAQADAEAYWEEHGDYASGGLARLLGE